METDLKTQLVRTRAEREEYNCYVSLHSTFALDATIEFVLTLQVNNRRNWSNSATFWKSRKARSSDSANCWSELHKTKQVVWEPPTVIPPLVLTRAPSILQLCSSKQLSHFIFGLPEHISAASMLTNAFIFRWEHPAPETRRLSDQVCGGGARTQVPKRRDRTSPSWRLKIPSSNSFTQMPMWCSDFKFVVVRVLVVQLKLCFQNEMHDVAPDHPSSGDPPFRYPLIYGHQPRADSGGKAILVRQKVLRMDLSVLTLHSTPVRSCFSWKSCTCCQMKTGSFWHFLLALLELCLFSAGHMKKDGRFDSRPEYWLSHGVIPELPYLPFPQVVAQIHQRRTCKMNQLLARSDQSHFLFQAGYEPTVHTTPVAGAGMSALLSAPNTPRAATTVPVMHSTPSHGEQQKNLLRTC